MYNANTKEVGLYNYFVVCTNYNFTDLVSIASETGEGRGGISKSESAKSLSLESKLT